jgi:ribosomal protein S18 acetylase RimI-like enzyme
MPLMDIRKPEASEIDHLAQLWYDGWQDAHALVVPGELKRLRTLQNFRERMRGILPQTRVIGPPGGALGFCTVKGDELYQLYVASAARGTNVAPDLMDDGEARLRDGGVKTAWLSVAIGNERAIRFYEKKGWRRIGKMTNLLDTIEGKFDLVTWRYEKAL